MHELRSARQGILEAFSINDASARINQKERRVTIPAAIEGTLILGFWNLTLKVIKLSDILGPA